MCPPAGTIARATSGRSGSLAELRLCMVMCVGNSGLARGRPAGPPARLGIGPPGPRVSARDRSTDSESWVRWVQLSFRSQDISFERAWALGVAGRVAEVGFEMRIGIVGSGKIGTTLAQLLLQGTRLGLQTGDLGWRDCLVRASDLRVGHRGGAGCFRIALLEQRVL